MLGVGAEIFFRSEYGVVDFNDEFPGRRIWNGHCYCRWHFPVTLSRWSMWNCWEIFPGPVQDNSVLVRLAGLHGLLVSADCLTWRGNNDALASTLSLCLLLARTAFLQQSATLMEASRMLDKSAGNSFFMIALPLAVRRLWLVSAWQ
ncbi:MAG: hypothetical protein Ct9H300mP21_09030 [Pseudomonadota bacterium]|nr:MAG: hypothetical protein Ct9H300mP21_09030 [Pseudomonadota bacterium]